LYNSNMSEKKFDPNIAPLNVRFSDEYSMFFINNALTVFKNGSASQEDNPFEKLLSMGELIDRLTIVNIKLFNLKNDVMNSDSEEFRAKASVTDVELVLERARLKRCIDTKLSALIQRTINGDDSGAYNPEAKQYGDK
jgi:hypothetical protein